MRHGFVERSIEGLFEAMERALYAETVAAGGGLLQRLDPRVKVAGLIGLVAAAALIFLMRKKPQRQRKIVFLSIAVSLTGAVAGIAISHYWWMDGSRWLPTR